MVDKTKYIEKFKALYRAKNGGTELSDAEALDYFEKLICLVDAITGHLPLDQVIQPKYGK